jgi:hypothetical protein
MQHTPPHPLPLTSILILSSDLCLGLPSGLFSSRFPNKTFCPHTCYMPCPSHLPWFDPFNYIWKVYKLWSTSWGNFLKPPTISSLLRGPFKINHVAQKCFVQHKFAQNMIPFTLPHGCRILVEFCVR